MVQRLAWPSRCCPTRRCSSSTSRRALDPEGLCAFYGVVSKHRREGKTILFTSHQLGDVERLADRIAVLVEGRLVAELTARELADRLADRGVMRIRVLGANDDVLARVRCAAPGAEWSGGELVVPGPATARPMVLDILRAAGSRSSRSRPKRAASTPSTGS